MLGVVEIPHLWRRLRRQLLLHREPLETATRAPSPRQGRREGGEGRRPLVRPRRRRRQGRPASLARSLPPSGARPPLSPPHTHTGSDAYPARPLAAQARPLKETRARRASAASRRAGSCRYSSERSGAGGQRCETRRPGPTSPATSRNGKPRALALLAQLGAESCCAATPPSGSLRRLGR